MLDETEPRGRIVAAALRLAEKRCWRDIGLGEIAAEAGIPIADFRAHFQSKAQILAAFSRAADEEVLRKFPAPAADGPRDRLFDIILTRLEILQPYKPALRRLKEGASLGAALAQTRPALKSHYWMLAAAGISGEGGLGLIRVKGLLALYLSVFAVWLDDDDPGMARTMAVLDRRLRRGETFIGGVQRVCGGFASLSRALKGRAPETPRAEAPDNGHGSPPQPQEI